MGQYDAQALAGQTFYRGIAAPGIANQYGYVGIINPVGSKVRTYLDAMYVWPGLQTQGAEVGIMHYATAFDNIPGFNFTGMVFFSCNRPSMADSKTQIYIGSYNALLSTKIDYVFVGPMNTFPSHLETPPYPYVILDPGDGIVVWNPTQGFELKVGAWIREIPIS